LVDPIAVIAWSPPGASGIVTDVEPPPVALAVTDLITAPPSQDSATVSFAANPDTVTNVDPPAFTDVLESLIAGVTVKVVSSRRALDDPRAITRCAPATESGAVEVVVPPRAEA